MDRLASRTFSLCLLFLVFTGSEGQGSQCQNGWFGDKCQYQCHCLNNEVCDKVTGECPGDCDRPWFGPQCQYLDAAYSTYTPLTDGTEFTCLDGSDLSQHFPMSKEVMFTWMRFVTNRPGQFDYVNITFLSRFEGKVTPKSSLRKIYSSDTVLYLYGELEDRFKTIRLEFDSTEIRQSFCSMQVSSGRNVAIKQKASQSTTWPTGGAEKAVDGGSTQTWIEGSCSSTSFEDSPYWTLNLSLPVTVNMYTILNAIASDLFCRLRYFRLETYFGSTKVQQYDKTDPVDRNSYDVYSLDASPITSVTLTAGKYFWPNYRYDCTNGTPAMNVCEMQIYGDVMCPPSKWGRNCEKDCNYCQDSSVVCFVSTGMCVSCKAGFYGAHCQEVCPVGQWGVDCLNHCDNCINGKCNKTSGECLSGCSWGYKMPYCVQECDAGFHGYNCTLSCPANCQDNICNNVDGTCVECVTGYQGPVCNQECDSTFYGANCITPCSDKCIDQLCHHITGVCHNCPDGKQISTDCSQDELNLVIIVVPVVVGLVVVAALITGICLWRRRINQQRGEGTYVNHGEIKGSHGENENGVDLKLENQDPLDDNYETIGINLNEDNQGSNENVNMNHYVNDKTQDVSGHGRISQPVNEETSDTNDYEIPLGILRNRV